MCGCSEKIKTAASLAPSVLGSALSLAGEVLTGSTSVSKAVRIARQAPGKLNAIVESGGAKTTRQERLQRLAACNACDKRGVVKCGECGCPVLELVKYQASKCPLERWT